MVRINPSSNKKTRDKRRDGYRIKKHAFGKRKRGYGGLVVGKINGADEYIVYSPKNDKWYIQSRGGRLRLIREDDVPLRIPDRRIIYDRQERTLSDGRTGSQMGIGEQGDAYEDLKDVIFELNKGRFRNLKLARRVVEFTIYRMRKKRNPYSNN